MLTVWLIYGLEIDRLTLAPSMKGVNLVESLTSPDNVTVTILCTNVISRFVLLNVGYSSITSLVAGEIDGVSVVVILQLILVDKETYGSESNS